MTTACTLENGVINLAALREDSRKSLLSILDSIGDNTCVVLDPILAGPFNHILVEGTGVLKEHGVKDFKELSRHATHTHCENVLFIVPPLIKAMKVISKHVKDSCEGGVSPHTYFLYFAPRRTLVCEQVLKNDGVYGDLTIGEYPLDFIPFDDDVLSLEMHSSFKECYLEGDKTSLMTVARSIMKLQALYGIIPHVKFKGNLGKIVWQMMMRLKKEESLDTVSAGVESEIDTLVLIDRKVDLITPMCTPLTYEGVIDEVLGISNGCVKVDPEILADEDGDKPAEDWGKKKKKIPVALNSNDALYADIRDFNVEQLGFHLQEKAKDIRERYDEFRKNKDASISEIHQFVKRIPGLKKNYQSLQTHINIAELIKNTTESKEFRDLWTWERTMLEGDTTYDQLEEAMATRQPIMKVLRLLCLQSLVNGGLRAKSYDFLRRELLQSYGYELLFTLNNLEKIGMLRKRDSSWVDLNNPYGNVKKALRLINENVNVREPDDIAYVTSGYAPLSVRLVEAALKPNGWASIQEPMRLLPGPTAEVSQTQQELGEMGSMVKSSETGGFSNADRKVMLVYYIGGVTFTEVAALRHLSKQPDCPYDIIIATTKLVNGNTLVKSLMEDIKSGMSCEV